MRIRPFGDLDDYLVPARTDATRKPPRPARRRLPGLRLGFLGDTNRFDPRVAGGRIRLDGFELDAPAAVRAARGDAFVAEEPGDAHRSGNGEAPRGVDWRPPWTAEEPDP